MWSTSVKPSLTNGSQSCKANAPSWSLRSQCTSLMLPHWQQNGPYIGSPGGNGWVKTKEEFNSLKETGGMFFLEASNDHEWWRRDESGLGEFMTKPKLWAIRTLVIENAALVIIGVLSRLPQIIVISGGQVWQVVAERISMVEQMIDGVYMVVSIVVNIESPCYLEIRTLTGVTYLG